MITLHSNSLNVADFDIINIMSKSINIRQYLAVLLVLILVSSIGYYFVRQVEPALLSVFYIGLFYMPTPFYALVLVSKLNKQPLNLLQYGRLKQVSARGILTTIVLFLSWLTLFGAISFLLSFISPELTGQFAINDTMLRENIQEYAGPEAASTADLPSSTLPLILVGLIGAILSGFTVNLLFALGEEYGWRGFLYRRVKGGFILKNTIIGGLWGMWHVPLILQGYNFGNELNIYGAIWFIGFTLSMGYLIGVLMERYRNVLYAGAMHGMFNGFAGIFPILLGSYNPLVGGPVGIVSAVSFLLIALIAYSLLHCSFDRKVRN